MDKGSRLSAPGSVSLDLRCPDCGSIQRHPVSSIYLGSNDIDAGPYVGDDLGCSFCGSGGPMSLTADLASEIVAQAQTLLLPRGTPNDRPGQLQVHLPGAQCINVRLFTVKIDARTRLSPVRAVDLLRGRLKNNPDCLVDLLRLGHIYLGLGPRRLALQCFEQCLRVDPGCLEAVCSLALIRERAGQLEEAFALLDSARRNLGTLRIYRAQKKKQARGTLERLSGQYNHLAEKLGKPKMPGRGPSLPLARQKPRIGRNDPCPCGSGKKHKHCCGARPGEMP